MLAVAERIPVHEIQDVVAFDRFEVLLQDFKELRRCGKEPDMGRVDELEKRFVNILNSLTDQSRKQIVQLFKKTAGTPMSNEQVLEVILWLKSRK